MIRQLRCRMKQNLFPTIACPLPLQQNPARDTFSQRLPHVWDCARCPETKKPRNSPCFCRFLAYVPHKLDERHTQDLVRGSWWFQEQMSQAKAQRQGTTSWVALLGCGFKAEIITRDGMERKFQDMDVGGPWGLDSELGMQHVHTGQAS